MPKAIVCLSAGTQGYAKIVRRLTGSNVNHAFIAYTSKEWGGWWAVQIDERGVVKIPVEKINMKSVECYDFPQLDLCTAMPRVRGLVGRSYDWRGILGFLINLFVWKTFGRSISKPIHRKGELFCSEFVTRYLQQVDGMPNEIMMLDPAAVAPGGEPHVLGTTSLQWELNNLDERVCKRVDAPWPF